MAALQLIDGVSGIFKVFKADEKAFLVFGPVFGFHVQPAGNTHGTLRAEKGAPEVDARAFRVGALAVLIRCRAGPEDVARWAARLSAW